MRLTRLRSMMRVIMMHVKLTRLCFQVNVSGYPSVNSFANLPNSEIHYFSFQHLQAHLARCLAKSVSLRSRVFKLL